MRTQRTDVKTVLGSDYKMNKGGSVVALDRERSYTRKKETNKKAKLNYEQGQHVTCVWAPVK